MELNGLGPLAWWMHIQNAFKVFANHLKLSYLISLALGKEHLYEIDKFLMEFWLLIDLSMLGSSLVKVSYSK